MELNDLTVILLTANRVPKDWAEYHLRVLKEAIGNTRLITISREQMPHTTLLDTEPLSYHNIYYQMLRGARITKTPYVAIAEDDTLYHETHFTAFRPCDDEFAYNRNRWSLFTWGVPTYSIKERISNCSLVAPTDLMVEALTERYNKHPDGGDVVGELGKRRTERHLRVTQRKQVDFYSAFPIVQFNHDFAHDNVQVNHKKKMGMIRAFDIPVWGRAEELVKEFK